MSDMRTRLAAIKKLEDKFGRVTAEKLVQAASDRKHPMHGDFTWDNDEAAHQYRLGQARIIIAHIKVVTSDVSKRVSTIGYVRDPNAAKHVQGYVAVSQLRTEREAAHEALLNEASRLQAQLERMQGIAAALDLVDELNAIVESVLALSSRLQSKEAA